MSSLLDLPAEAAGVSLARSRLPQIESSIRLQRPGQGEDLQPPGRRHLVDGLALVFFPIDSVFREGLLGFLRAPTGFPTRYSFPSVWCLSSFDLRFGLGTPVSNWGSN